MQNQDLQPLVYSLCVSSIPNIKEPNLCMTSPRLSQTTLSYPYYLKNPVGLICVLWDFCDSVFSARLPVAQWQSLICQCKRRAFSPWEGKIPGNGNWLQYSCLGNPMDSGAWRSTVYCKRVRHDLVTKHSLPEMWLPWLSIRFVQIKMSSLHTVLL